MRAIIAMTTNPLSLWPMLKISMHHTLHTDPMLGPNVMNSTLPRQKITLWNSAVSWVAASMVLLHNKLQAIVARPQLGRRKYNNIQGLFQGGARGCFYPPPLEIGLPYMIHGGCPPWLCICPPLKFVPSWVKSWNKPWYYNITKLQNNYSSL